jgi:type IX secretion system PorP/SprF family membrane protein
MKKVILSLLVLISISTNAQDTHYSQFFNSPLTLNPALTGLTKGSARFGAIYRNQWFSAVNNGFFNSPFQTPSAFVDAPIRIKNDAIGVGGMFLYDRAGAGSFTTFQGQASLSYIKGLGRNGNHQISAGFQLGYTQVRLVRDDLQFTSQFDNNNQFTGNPFGFALTPNVGYVNLNVGLLYYGQLTKNLSMYVGGAFFNATGMKYNLSSNNEKRELYFRGNAQMGFDIRFGKFHLLPSALFMQQAKADQLNTGLGFGFDFTENVNMTLGIYNRANNVSNKFGQVDAIIPYAGFEVKNFKLGASYDFTLTRFKEAGNGTGALEISLMYIIMPKKNSVDRVIFCPRF